MTAKWMSKQTVSPGTFHDIEKILSQIPGALTARRQSQSNILKKKKTPNKLEYRTMPLS